MTKITMHKGKMEQIKPLDQKLQSPPSWGSGRGGRPWRRKRDQVILRDNQICQVCGLLALKPEVDHIIPVCAGGTEDMDNLQTLCATPCHKNKTARESRGEY